MTVNKKSRTILIDFNLVNIGMSDAKNVTISAKMLDSEKQIEATSNLTLLKARDNQSLNL